MIKVYAVNGYVTIEQSGATEEDIQMVFSYAEVEKLREELIRAQIAIKEKVKVAFVKEEK